MSEISLCRINKEKQVESHLETNHPNCLDKPAEFFVSTLNSIQRQKNAMTKFATKNKLAVYSSCVASYQIAKQKKIIQLVRIC